MKYYVSIYYHATMAATGINPAGFTAPQGSEIIVSPDGMGFFIQRATKGTGSVDFDTVKFVWDYGTDGISDANAQAAATTFRLFAVEMTYVPQGAFYAGDGTSTPLTGQFEEAKSGDAKEITSESTLVLGGGAVGALGNNNTLGMTTVDDFADSSSQVLPAGFPKGYNAFYLMKYMISQGQYRDFLNTLSTYAQQETRTSNVPESAAGTGALITGNSYRCGLDIKTSGTDPTIPATYGCNLDADANYDEAVDGEWIACNYLSWADVAAYSDWAGLRPFTELEYEKAARGPLAAVANEYAWGAATVASSAYRVSSSGATDENTSANYSTTSGNALYTTTESDFSGPCRCGMFAGDASNTGRVTAGAGYYGNMELSGNLEERTVTVGNVTGRLFTGTHGNGEVDSTGNADVSSWPGTDAVGVGFRGSAWSMAATVLRVSDRSLAAYTITTRAYNYGGRCVRTAP